jgi:hypothetical protein
VGFSLQIIRHTFRCSPEPSAVVLSLSGLVDSLSFPTSRLGSFGELWQAAAPSFVPSCWVPRPCHFQLGRFSRPSVRVAKPVAGLCAFANLSSSHHQTNMPSLFNSAAHPGGQARWRLVAFQWLEIGQTLECAWEPPARPAPQPPLVRAIANH